MEFSECEVGMRVVCSYCIDVESPDLIRDADGFAGKEGTIVWVRQSAEDHFYDICVEFDDPSGIEDRLWDCDDLVPRGNGRYGFASSVEPLSDQQAHEQPITMSIESLL